MEKYNGIKFKIIDTKKEITNQEELVELGKRISKIIKINGNEGNLSIRKKDGFLIKKAGKNMGNLKLEDVVLVTGLNEDRIYCANGEPSSESRMHYLIYEKRKDVKMILHFHLDKLLDKKIGFEIGPFEYGTAELAESAAKASEKKDLIKIKGHGFILIAENKNELIGRLKDLCDSYGLC